MQHNPNTGFILSELALRGCSGAVSTGFFYHELRWLLEKKAVPV